MWRVGFVDSQFTGAARSWLGVGDDKHSWALAWGGCVGWGDKGCLLHNRKRKKWMATDLRQVPTIGLAIDLSSRTIFFVTRDAPDKEPELRVAFEGISFSTGLAPAASFFCSSELKFNFGGPKDEQFKLFSKVPELQKRGFMPVARSGQPVIASPVSDAGTISLVASSGRDFLTFDDTANPARTLHAAAFLCSAKATGVLLREGKYFYEATVECVGGEGHSKAFQPYDLLGEDDSALFRTWSKAREEIVDLAKLPPGGGRGAIGWAEKRFFGQYDRFEGIGDDRFSWAISGANLAEGKDAPNADENDKDKDNNKNQADGAGDELCKDDKDEAKFAEKAASSRFVELRHNASAQKRRNINPLRFAAARSKEKEKEGGAAESCCWLDGKEHDFVWRDGTVIGCAVELTELAAPGSFLAKFRYFVDGAPLECAGPEPAELVAEVNDGLVPAVTCHANMRVSLNFGERKFEHEQNARGYEAVIKALESSGTVKKSAADKRPKGLTSLPIVTTDNIETEQKEEVLEWKEGAQLIEGLRSENAKSKLKVFAKGELVDGFLDLKNDLSEENPIKEMRVIVQILLLCPHARNPKTCVRKVSVDANVLLGAAGIQELATLLEVRRRILSHLFYDENNSTKFGLTCPASSLLSFALAPSSCLP